jgi:hypothetical protein
MKSVLIFIVLIFLVVWVEAQKKVIPANSSIQWPEVANPVISDNGKYIAYRIICNAGFKMIIQQVAGDFKMEFDSAMEPVFTTDCKFVYFKKGRDSLGILDLKKGDLKYRSGLRQYTTLGKKSNWLICQFVSSDKKVILFDLSKEKEILFNNVESYETSSFGNALLLKKETSDQNIKTLLLYNFSNDQEILIGNYKNPQSFVFDRLGKSIAFVTNFSINETKTNLNYYKLGFDTAVIIASTNNKEFTGMRIFNPFFSLESDKLFFYIQKIQQEKSTNDLNPININIQTYRDDSLNIHSGEIPFLSVVNTSLPYRPKRLQQQEDIGLYYLDQRQNSDHLLIESHIYGNRNEYQWRNSAIPDFYLINTNTGKRYLIKEKLKSSYIQFSLGGKYIIWFDQEKENWFTYDIITGAEKNITKSIATPLFLEDDHPDVPRSIGIAGWLRNDSAVLIYDRFDIWCVDPKGISLPINLTNEYGKRNNIRFRYLDLHIQDPVPITTESAIFLSAFNTDNKEAGFFKLTIYNRVLVKLIMESKVFYPGIYPDFDQLFKSEVPIKADRSDIYLLTIMSSTEYPNLYVTQNFKEFQKITNLEPQKEYNWISSELFNWVMPEGTIGKGLLYKPENFNPQKKYPLIFYYYEQNSDGLNVFLKPGLSTGQLNIPTYVSNDYLVFVPDIQYEVGHPGESAFKTIYSAAKSLSKKYWIDSTKMGLQGHSFGAYQTNYVVTRTTVFAAAIASSGLTDMVSKYNGNRFQWYFENRQGRIGSTLWERPDLFIENSPVFHANKITTPLLIIHTKNDAIYPFAQAEEWYNSLIRLSKRAWMVTYNEANHTVEEFAERLDYSIRMMQFFDYYLKDKPAPKWMTGNYDPEVEGIKVGFDSDLKLKP